MNRSFKLSMLMALALGSSQAVALDLGQIQVKSALGQPLLAEIPLHPANPGELKGLTVQLASSEDFDRAGIVGGRTSIPLNFSVANAGAGHQVIRITSSVAVDNPYIDLLLEVNGKAGKSVREFVILLDPPGTTEAAPAAAPAMAVKAARPAAGSPAPSSRAVPTGAGPEAAQGGTLGPVQRGQTLSAIAKRVVPPGVDMNQMLLALKQANPDAFYRDNVNALKSGAILRMPTSAEAQALTVAAALAEVRRQNSDWRAGPTVKPTLVADAATRAGATSSPTGPSGKPVDRLALVPPKEAAGAEGGAVARRNAKAMSDLNQDLLRAKESVASLQQQGSDLKTRLKDMADINSKNERLLSLKDNEIAELQRKLAEARKAAQTTASTSPSGEASPAPAATVAETTPVAAPVSTAAAPATAATIATVAAASSAPATASTAMSATPLAAGTSAEQAGKEVKPVVKPIIKPVATPASAVVEQPWYMQTWVLAAGGGAVALLLLLLAMRSRKPKSAANGPSSLADRFAASTPEAAAGDDVDQDELLEQLAEHPDDIYLHLELVTLYYSRRDEERFEAAAEAMYAHVTDPQQDEWQDVVHMGEDLVPGHPLFSPHGGQPAPQGAHDQQTFDIDDFAADDDAPTVVSTTPATQAPKKVSEYNFDFNLTTQRPQPSESDNTVVAPVVAAQDADGMADALSSDWPISEPVASTQDDDSMLGTGEFSDDPSDTKLDLARAYLDMGDADGARAMLGEVIKEGSRLQQETARRLLDGLN